MAFSAEEVGALVTGVIVVGGGAFAAVSRLRNRSGNGKPIAACVHPCDDHEKRLRTMEGDVRSVRECVHRVEGSVSGLYRKLDDYREERISIERSLGELTGEIRARFVEKP